jgi:hypothetical protein
MSIPLHDLAGHLGYIIILCGTLLLGTKSKAGWIFRLIGDCIWVAIGVYIGMTSIVTWSAIFALNELYNFRKWSKK